MQFAALKNLLGHPYNKRWKWYFFTIADLTLRMEGQLFLTKNVWEIVNYSGWSRRSILAMFRWPPLLGLSLLD